MDHDQVRFVAGSQFTTRIYLFPVEIFRKALQNNPVRKVFIICIGPQCEGLSHVADPWEARVQLHIRFLGAGAVQPGRCQADDWHHQVVAFQQTFENTAARPLCKLYQCFKITIVLKVLTQNFSFSEYIFTPPNDPQNMSQILFITKKTSQVRPCRSNLRADLRLVKKGEDSEIITYG